METCGTLWAAAAGYLGSTSAESEPDLNFGLKMVRKRYPNITHDAVEQFPTMEDSSRTVDANDERAAAKQPHEKTHYGKRENPQQQRIGTESKNATGSTAACEKSDCDTVDEDAASLIDNDSVLLGESNEHILFAKRNTSSSTAVPMAASNTPSIGDAGLRRLVDDFCIKR